MTREDYYKELIKSSTQNKLKQFVSSRIAGIQQAEDILQEVNFKIIEKYPDYKDEGKFISWAYAVAYWTIKAFQKKAALSKIVYDSELIFSLSNSIEDETQNNNFDFVKLRRELDLIIQGYNEDRQVVAKLLMQGYKSREVHDNTGIPIKFIYKTKQRIKKDIKKELKANKTIKEYLQ